MPFKLISDFKPTGDQPEAIRQLKEALNAGVPFQTLLGVTGSGKTFTMANVMEQVQRPALVLSHNKTLAAQLYGEFKQFFPENAVEYFVSYYDYYQPEAYLPVTDTYIEKDLSINEEIEKLRLSTTSSLLSGRRDVVVVSSVSCIYGIGNPDDFYSNTIHIRKNMILNRNQFLRKLVDSLYSRNEVDFNHGHFRVSGETVDVNLAYNDFAYRFVYFGDEIEEIQSFDPLTGKVTGSLEEATIYPANIFVTTRARTQAAIRMIQDDMMKQVDFPKEKIADTLRVSGRHVSVDAPFVEGEDNSLLDVLVNNDSPIADRDLIKESLCTEIERSLSTLTERERDIIKYFFGIGQQEMTLEEIGDRFGLTRERVRQIKEKAIRRLRHTSRSKLLKSYLG